MIEDEHVEPCRNEARLMLYHDGELPPDERREFEAHVAGCPVCAHELEGLRAMSRLLAEAEAAGVPDGMLTRLHAAVPSAPELTIVRVCRPVAAAAAVVLAVCAALLAGGEPPAPAQQSAPEDWEMLAVAPDADLAQTDAQETWAVWTLHDLAGGNGS